MRPRKLDQPRLVRQTGDIRNQEKIHQALFYTWILIFFPVQDYLDSDPSGRSGIPITTIKQREEPRIFTGWFHAWDAKFWQQDFEKLLKQRLNQWKKNMKQKTPAKIHYPAFITGLQRIINIRDIGDFKPHKILFATKECMLLRRLTFLPPTLQRQIQIVKHTVLIKVTFFENCLVLVEHISHVLQFTVTTNLLS